MNRKNLLLISLLFLGCHFVAKGQGSICPPNVDFEFGDLSVWTFSRGTVTDGPVYALTPSPPTPGWHDLMTGPATDYYGGFPVVAPGGGNFSLKLGRGDTNNRCAEQAIYYVDVPAGTTVYQLIYHYAAVLEIPTPTPHPPDEEPRFVVEAYDSATGAPIACAAYTYVSGAAGSGFIHSPVPSLIPGNFLDVWYKPWTFGNMKFYGENGRTVAIQFTANDCTLGQHFGYGYADMSCGLFANVIACGTTTETLTAPPGFATYQWLDSTTMLTSFGTTQTITVPAPAGPTTYAVIATPAPGYGCPDTLFSRLIPSHLVITPGNDTTICSGNGVTLNLGATDIASPLVYNWTPTIGLSCSTCANPVASPAVTRTYTGTVTDPGGCSLNHAFTITVFPTPAPLSGALNACLGTPITLTDGIGGGVWVSSNTAAATIGSSSGIIYGQSLDTTTVTYSFGGGLCSTSAVVTVNPLPFPIVGSVPICPGGTISLADATTGGTWSSSNTAMAVIDPSGNLTGVNPLGGNVNIIYTGPTGCPNSTIATVNPLSPITGVMSVCTGLTTTLSDLAGGGTWVSSNTAVATVDATTGVVTGLSVPGDTATISYTTPAGCVATTTITVNPLPAAILGGMSICPGTSTILTESSTGGAWSSSSALIASVTVTGSVTGGVSGIDTIIYTLPTSCRITADVTVNPTPPAITGPTSLCTGSAIILNDAITGGTWSSSATSVATANLTTGVVGGVAVLGGTTTITYTSPAGCPITRTEVVNPLPAPILGLLTVCEGQTRILTDATTGGTWMSSNVAVATVSPSGAPILTIDSGTTIITYTLITSCSTSVVLTVNVTPLPITGTSSCVGSTITLTDGITGGTWSSGTTSVATIGSITGTVTPVGPAGGNTLITYAMSTGCSASATITLNPLPTLFPVTGGGIYCAGSPTIHIGLAGSTVGVIYQLYNGVGVSGAPILGTGFPLDFGVETLPGTYTVVATNTTTGCTAPMPGSATITVNPVPPVFGVSGGGSYCAGGTGFHVLLSGSTPGINYQAHNGLFVTPIFPGTGSSIDFGIETLGGTYTVIATNPLTGCTSTMTGSATITVLPLPPLFAITGGGGYCSGGGGVPVGLSGSTVGITYELFDGLVGLSAMAGTGAPFSFGFMVSPGVYTVLAINGSTGCSTTMPGSVSVSINPLPAPITGPASVCVGATITELDDSLGGTWSSSITANASIGSLSGIVTGGASSTSTTITYTLPTGCVATRTINISLSPGTISGPTAVCVGSSIPETNPVAAGVWSSGNTSIATVTPLGAVYGASAGTTTIIYTMPTSGCFTSVVVTVNPLPLPITGTTSVCVGLVTTLNDASTGGTWSCLVPSIATVTTTPGNVHGVGGGIALISYTLPTGCLTTTTVTVYPSPAAISGSPSVCQNATILLTDAVTGGTWSSSNTTVATIGINGIVYPIAPISTTITYTLPGNCTTTTVVVVNPIAPITGFGVVCQGSTTTLHDATPGGSWSSSATGIATVTGGGVVGGVAPGTATITYTTTAGCTTTFVVTVNITPTPITGVASVCVGSSTALGDGVLTGTWSSSSTGVATVTPSGVVWGAVAGTSTITYELLTGCLANIVVTVNPLPAPIAGVATVCDGLLTSLSDPTTGGTWSSSNSLLASVSPSGFVRGLSPSVETIYYTITATGCVASILVTVNPLPAPLAGPASICVDYTTALTETTPGGTWTSSATSIATVGSGTSVDSVYGVAPGTSIITYTLPTGCLATQMVTVVPVPTAIAGPPMVCVGQFIPLTVPGAPGGTWTTGPASLAAIGLTNGILSGVSTGTVLVSYTIGVGCYVVDSRIVNGLSPIFGDSVLCVGQTVTLNDTTAGGTWSSVNPPVATAITSGVSTGTIVATGPGTANILYILPTGCTATSIITVNPLPAGITGVTNVCVDNTTLLNDATPGGEWSSSDTSIAVILDPTSGSVTGVSAGSVSISYTVIATGCPRSITVSVNALPTPISGPGFVCPGSAISLTDVGFGTWSVAPASIATIGLTSGILTGIIPGIVNVTYTLPVTGCSTTTGITVEPLPDAITGLAVACLGSTTTLSDATSALGGVWSSSNTTIAPVGLFTGTVSGDLLGTATITFTTSFGCTTNIVVTVDPSPAAITGTGAVCPGATLTLSDGTSGGTWSSSSTFVATVTSDGVVTGVHGGTATVSYTLGGYCAATTIVTVNPPPSVISGALHVCSIGTGTVIDASSGGLWSSSNTAVGVILPTSGLISGVSPGTTTITYTLPTTCSISTVVTVDVMPDPIAGPNHACVGSTITLADSVGGGVWSSQYPGVATVGSATGIVSGASFGVTTITYAIGACNVESIINVYNLPGIYTVTGGGSYCAGGSGVTIGLNGSATGIMYYLYHGATATGTFAGTSTPLNFGLQTVAGSYTVVAIATGTGCSSTMAGSALITITPTITPSVSIIDTPGLTVCAGTAVTFNPTPVAGGLSPAYQWSVNGVDVAITHGYTFVPANGDTVRVRMTSDTLCPAPAVVSSSVIMSVLLPGTPEVGIATSPDDTVCDGALVTMTALPLFGGSSPSYVWTKNGGIAGSDPIYTFLPSNGDVVYCTMTSNYICRLANTATSADVTMTVDTPMTPMVTITATPGTEVSVGAFDTLTASVSNGGPHPTYQWFKNGLPVAGATTNTYMSNNYAYPTEDSITCMVTADNACHITSFQWVYINVTKVGVTNVHTAGSDIMVIPNPNRGTFTIKGSLGTTGDDEIFLQITDMIGQVVYNARIMTHNGEINERVSLSNVANGMYLLNLHSATGNEVFHIVVEQ